MSIKKRKKPSCSLFICCADALWRKGLGYWGGLRPAPYSFFLYPFPSWTPSSSILPPSALVSCPHILFCFPSPSSLFSVFYLSPLYSLLSLSPSPTNYLLGILILWLTYTPISPLHTCPSSPNFPSLRPLAAMTLVFLNRPPPMISVYKAYSGLRLLNGYEPLRKSWKGCKVWGFHLYHKQSQLLKGFGFEK